ncbi:hypothetical protein I7I53_09561 [Histoplasma capsulatum var. duboisii H88]|uniref:Uncharacterized protein n=1 Tax=Ajellomyces capsulatus (strain H88) TaxID=544711 RepID=A0A8A1L996_AJEC8|nr:hypothetical protein I7I53_09561 [Histoplasma capsulatum var. duboisii H88]
MSNETYIYFVKLHFQIPHYIQQPRTFRLNPSKNLHFSHSVHPQPILLMILLQTIPTILLMHALPSLRPAHPSRLRVRKYTHHLLGHRQLGINRCGERMYQLGPVLVPYPQHSAAV